MRAYLTKGHQKDQQYVTVAHSHALSRVRTLACTPAFILSFLSAKIAATTFSPVMSNYVVTEGKVKRRLKGKEERGEGKR